MAKMLPYIFPDPESDLAKRETLNPATPNLVEQLHIGLNATKNARKKLPDSFRNRFRIFTYDDEALGTYLIFDPEGGAGDYAKGEWVKAERVHFDQPVKGRDISHGTIQISTWRDNQSFVKTRLKEFNECMKKVKELTD